MTTSIAFAGQLETNGASAQLTAKHKATLKQKGMRFIVPTWVPPQFKLKLVELAKDPNIELRDFDLKYSNKSANIGLSMASDGIGDPIFEDGDPDGTSHVMANNPILGKVSIESRMINRIRYFHCTWVETKTSLPRFLMISGQGLSLSDAKRFYEGLRWLKVETKNGK